MHLRRIESSEESEKKRKKNTLILSIVMISILMFSTAGYFAFDNDGAEASGEKVENIGDGWVFYYGEQPIRTEYSTEDAKNVTIQMDVESLSLSENTVYIASDSDSALNEAYLPLMLVSGRVQEACFGECTENLPEKDCNDTMVVIKTLNTTNEIIYQRDNCVFIEGGLNSVDAFIYKLFGKI